MYMPIAEHGIIGDLHTAALVGTDGTIDWFCAPHFDSPSVFASILDDEIGGCFKLRPISDDAKSTQYYLPETNVLVTRFTTDEGVMEVVDFMPVRGHNDESGHHLLVRRITGIRGELKVQVECRPRFNYGLDRHEVEFGEDRLTFRSETQDLEFWSTAASQTVDGDVVMELTVSSGHTEYFALDAIGSEERSMGYDRQRYEELFDETVHYWRSWINRCSYSGRWREMVHRSALVLKLLTFEPTGAFVASPTTSLPEHIGGERNWDYRYTWIRDAGFSVYGLIRIGLTEEAGHFMDWLQTRCSELGEDGSLQIMYGIDGRHELEEVRSEERRGGRECRSRWWPYQ